MVASAIIGGISALTPAEAIMGGAVVSGLANASSASSASNAQQASDATAANDQMAMFNQTQANQQPWLNAGDTALGQMTAGTAAGGQFNHTFDASDLNSQLAPNYNFQLQQGLGAVNNQASVTGGLVGGNALEGINNYAQNTAAGAYQNAFNNYNTSQTNVFNRLASIAGQGQTAANTGSTTGATTAGNVASSTMAGGAAQAAGIVGTGNAISNIANSASGASMYNALTGGSNTLGTYSGNTNTAYGLTTNAGGDNTAPAGLYS